ncbi:hypothetical protein D3C72_1023400 [compost metagenome]
MGAQLRIRVHAARGGRTGRDDVTEKLIINSRRVVKNVIAYVTAIVLSRVIGILGIGGLRIELQPTRYIEIKIQLNEIIFRSEFRIM